LKTIELNEEGVTVEFTEFEVMALAALVEQAQAALPIAGPEQSCIRAAINRVAGQFGSLLGHFELTT